MSTIGESLKPSLVRRYITWLRGGAAGESLSRGETTVVVLLLAPTIAIFVPFFMMPMVVLGRYSLSLDDATALIVPDWVLTNYLSIISQWYYIEMYINTFGVSLLITLMTLFIGYPFAYYIVRISDRWRSLLIWLIYLPLLVSVIARTFGWMVILGDGGLINGVLMGLGWIENPLRILYEPQAMLVGMTHRYLPIMILPVAAAIVKTDPTLIRASRGLGEGPIKTFFRVELPLSLPGIVAGSQLVFAAVLSDFVLPQLLGSTRFRMLAPAIYEEAIGRMSWANAAAVACLGVVIMAMVLLISNVVFRRYAPWARAI